MALEEDGRSSCIDENAVLDFIQGRLGRDHAARVDEHADQCVACRKAIDAAVRAFRERATGVDDGPVQIARFSPGDKLADRYRIVRLIARGGMGEVYEAEDEILGTRIALKTIAATIADSPEAARRLTQEVTLARRITHPNVCRIFDLGLHGSGPKAPGVRFITMELIPGVSLAQRMKERGRFPTQEALPIVTGMAAALGAAHRAGVVHRDFKPDNVMLAAGPDGERIVVTDFGLARNNAPATHDSVQGRGLEGTLAYMAPEQLEGQGARQPADIYALGLVMYEMLAGQLPFAPPSDGAWLAAAWRRVVEPIPPVRTLVPDVEVRWSDAIERCLERDPARRTASADQVARALAGETTGEVPSSPGRTEDPPAAEVVPPGAVASTPATLSRAPRRVWTGVVIAGVGVAAVLIAALSTHRRAPAAAAASAPPPLEPAQPATVLAPRPAPAAAGVPPAPEVPKAAAAAQQRPPAAVHRRRPAHHEQATAPAAEATNVSAPPAPDAGAAPARRRSVDPADGFIVK